MAIYMVGVKPRLVLDSLIQKVVERIVADNFNVHVYVSLIFNSSGTGSWLAVRKHGVERRDRAGLDQAGIQLHIADAMRVAGGCLVCADIPMRPTSVVGIPLNDGQLWKYPPNTSQTGRRVLDLWKRREQLWNVSLTNEQASKRQYSLGMWVRDGCYWLDNIVRPSKLLAAPKAENTVWTRWWYDGTQCSDKTVVFGRAAAPSVLGLFSTFMSGGFKVSTRTTEHFLFQAINHSGLILNYIPFKNLPESDAMYLTGDRLCMLRTYWREKAKPRIPFCEDIVAKEP